MTGEARAGEVSDKAQVSVLLPRALLTLFPEAEREVEISARTVEEIIAALDQRWPGMRDRLCDSTPRVRRHINVFVEGQRAGLNTPVKGGTKVYILTAISGG
jgi:molybdopterin converting factor small subunit